MECARCGGALAEGWRFCPACGRRADRPTEIPLRRRQWWRVLLVGTALYGATMWTFAATGNLNLAPLAVLLGAFAAPIAYVTYLYETDALYDVPPSIVALTFISGGLLGVVGAQLIEPNLVRTLHVVGIIAVALSEELAKALAIVWLARSRVVGSTRHGILLGAAAGLGFAACETMGHAFRALLDAPADRELLTQVLLTRALLSPLAHATWTALIVGVFWRDGRRVTPTVAAAFVTAVGLHGIWNWSLGAIPLELVVPGVDLALPLPALVVGAIGILLVRAISRQSRVYPTPADRHA